MQPDSHLHLVCRHEMTFHNTLVSREGKCWMVFLMGLSVAKRPTGDLIYRGRTWQNVLMRELCVPVHVCLLYGKDASGKCIQVCFYRKSHHILVKLYSFSKNWSSCTLKRERPDQWGGRQLCEVRKSRVHKAEIKQGIHFEKPKCFHHITNYQNSNWKLQGSATKNPPAPEQPTPGVWSY